MTVSRLDVGLSDIRTGAFSVLSVMLTGASALSLPLMMHVADLLGANLT